MALVAQLANVLLSEVRWQPPAGRNNFLSCLQLGAILTGLNNFNICATDVFTVFGFDKIGENVFIELGAEIGVHAGKCATVDKGLCGVMIASSKSNETLTMMECKPGKTNNEMSEESTDETGLDEELMESTDKTGLDEELMDTKCVEDVFDKNEQFSVSFVKDSGGRFHHKRTGIG